MGTLFPLHNPKRQECSRSEASKGAVVYYRKSLATKEMWYARLSRRVKNMTNSLLFLDVTIGRFQNLEPIISNPLLLLF